MTTPAQRHFLAKTAEIESAKRGLGSSMAGATGYELMLAKLAEDRRSLKQIQSTELKIEFKRATLPNYADYVTGALTGGRGSQDDVLTTIMVWYLDTADYAHALPIAEYAMTHGMTMPDQFKRTTATLVAEEVADTELRKNTAQQLMDTAAICQTIAMTAGQDMPDQVRAKLHKAAGYALRENNRLAESVEQLRRAMTLHEKVGVKRDIELIERDIVKLTPAEAPTETTPPECDPTKTGAGPTADAT